MTDRNCKCGAAPWTTDPNLWHCGTSRDSKGTLHRTQACRADEAALKERTIEDLAEFRRGVHTAYHAYSTGALNAEEFVADVVRLLIVLPEQENGGCNGA